MGLLPPNPALHCFAPRTPTHTMENIVQALRALQEIDMDLFRVNEELRRLPEERSRRQAQLDAIEGALEAKRTGMQGLQVRIKEIEDTVVVQQQRIRKLEKESTSSRDVSVVEACRYEMRGLKRQIDEAEREALSYVETVEASQAEAAALEDRLATERSVFEEYSANVDSELGDAQGRQEVLVNRRTARLDADLDLRTLELYDRLLQARGGEALAVLDGGICQACFMQVPPNLKVRVARGQDLVQCSSCDRILYLL